MVLTGINAQILQALRAGSLSSFEIYERWPNAGSTMTGLIRKYYIEKFNESEYRITALGREVCPNRNPRINQLQNKCVETPPENVIKPTHETIALLPELDIASLTKPLIPIFTQPIEVIKHTRKPQMETLENTKPKALLMLEYIEANPNCTMQQMQAGLSIKELGESFIIDYIKNGHIKAALNAKNKKEYALTRPLAEFYTGTRKAKAPIATLSTVIEAAPVHPAPEYEIPAFLRKEAEPEQAADPLVVEEPPALEFEAPTAPATDTFEQAREESRKALSELLQKTITKNKTRFAVTNDRTLLILDGDTTIELDEEATRTLMDFCENISMSLVV